MQHLSSGIKDSQPYYMAGLFTLSLRLVVGWTYFSAFWRRLVLENKLDPDTAGYIGEKFNHFLPNALGIKPIIEYLVTHPEALWWAMTIFTITEAIVGLFFLLGLFTRFMSIGVFGLAMGILLGAGWLGTTCLDEWQIGVLGIAAGFTIFLSGSGRHSLDYWLSATAEPFTRQKWFAWFGSGPIPLPQNRLHHIGFAGAVLILLLTLFTNQYFHGGIWGTLHNKSVKPKLEISGTSIKQGQLSFTLSRVEGADVYGSFLIGISLKDKAGNVLLAKDGEALAALSKSYIQNHYVAKIKPGKHSLEIPLGAKAELLFREEALQNLPAGEYLLQLTDISGATWEDTIIL
ncbi:DoxX family membrane protein [Rufibacter immobilis]|uniref:DoxX family membrane protein n=1 Tax=Rufibacter immobilis TaxID=1348778 RepID=A0A3M9MS87_9BACT|nr:TQO small subunit DoxD [Rufibacter immobilis]RNI28067.1 DoxX family membrane protein [Rufibacter immobilis]